MLVNDKFCILESLFKDNKLSFDWSSQKMRLKKLDLKQAFETNNLEFNEDNEKEIIQSLFNFMRDLKKSIFIKDFESDILNEYQQNLEGKIYRKINNEAELGNSRTHNHILGTNYEVLTKRSKLNVESIIAYNCIYHVEYLDLSGKENIISFELSEEKLDSLIDELLELKEILIKLKDK